MNKCKIIISVILIIALMFPCVSTISASVPEFPISQNERLSLIDAMESIELEKEVWGAENIDFSRLEIGNAIYAYNYISDQFVADRTMYPLIFDGQLVFWAIPINGQFQISQMFVDDINCLIESDTKFALAFDIDSAYILLESGQVCMLWNDVTQAVSSRSALNAGYIATDNSLIMRSLSECFLLGYTSDSDYLRSTTPTNIYCNVEFVSQNPPSDSKLCWAACVACVVNYVKGESLNAVTVAQNYYGSDNYNRYVSANVVSDVLSHYYVDYMYTSSGNFESLIFDSILDDYPTIGQFQNQHSSGHVVVIYGINVIAARIRIMDPAIGMLNITASNSTYTYVGTNNTTYTLVGLTYSYQ